MEEITVLKILIFFYAFSTQLDFEDNESLLNKKSNIDYL